jgi:hypothetical protein
LKSGFPLKPQSGFVIWKGGAGPEPSGSIVPVLGSYVPPFSA